MKLDPADVILVNAGASRPTDTWLDAMKQGGRMVLPLTVSVTTEDGHLATRGAIFLVERQADHYAARCISTTWIYPCAGARDEESELALEAALKNGDIARVTRLRRTDDVPEERCSLRGRSWCRSAAAWRGDTGLRCPFSSSKPLASVFARLARRSYACQALGLVLQAIARIP